MKIEPIDGKSVKISMTQQDMIGWGLCFENMSGRDRATNAAVAKLLTVLHRRTGMRFDGAVTVEAVQTDDGCVLLFTVRRHALLSNRPLPQIYAIETVDGLLAMGEALSCLHTLPSASLYGWGEAYRLVVYPSGPIGCASALWEFCERVGEGAAAAAFVDEYGVAITIGNALHLLCGGLGSP